MSVENNVTKGRLERAVLYARVSSKEQDKDGFSNPSQQKLLRGYASTTRFTVDREFIDVETAKHAGRTSFGEMVSYLKNHPACRILLVEKTDRLYPTVTRAASWVIRS